MNAYTTTHPSTGGSTSAPRGMTPIMKGTITLFTEGGRCLFNSGIDRKTAAIMSAMCLPALAFCSLLTLPGMIFRSPDQHAYYYFGQTINNDPVRWLVLLLAAACVIASIAVPSIERRAARNGHH